MEDQQWEQAEKLFLEAVGAELREERRFQKLNQEQISAQTGLNRSTISDLENARNFSHASAWRVAMALGLPWSLIIARAERRFEERRSAAGLPSLSAYAEAG